jgi:hypothetical protein
MNELAIILMIALCIAVTTCVALYCFQGTVSNTDTVAALVFSGLMVAPLRRPSSEPEAPEMPRADGDHRGLR